MNKIGIPIIALLILVLGTIGITNSLATQNVKIEDTEDTSEKKNIKKTEELLIQNNLKSLIGNKRLAIQTLTTNFSYEENRLESVSFKAQENNDEPMNTVEYIVESGDTLVNIATAFEVEASELAEWNESVTLNSQLQINDAIEIETALDPETIQPEKLTWEKKEAVGNETDFSDSITETNDTVTDDDDSAETLTVVATAYSRNQPALTNITAMGIDLRDNSQVIAVDPDFIPLGTRVFVEGYGEAIAGDTGSAINGNRVDLHMESMDESFTWGIQEVELTVLD